MDASKVNETNTKNVATSERKSDRELVVTRTFNAPASLVFEAWTKPELMRQWWVPKSFGMNLVECTMDVRVGGSYRFVFLVPGDPEKKMAFFGKYLEVKPCTRLVWSNEESADGAVTTVSLEERGGKTHLVMSDLYPSKKALDEAMVSGATSGFDETFDQLEALLAR